MSEKKRMAGDALYSGEDEYGKWGSTWDNKAEQQQLKASGKYNAESDLAKQFSGMKENISSRVDDEDGWRQLSIDGDLKDPTKYAELVNKWSGAGFDVRAIDMGKGFHSSNIAVRIAQGDGTGIENPVGDIGDIDNSSSPEQSINAGGPKPEQGIPYPGFGSGYQTQNVNQDNDINSTVTGNDNNVTNTQDNRVTQVGGRGKPQYAFGLKDAYVNRILNR